MTGRRWLLLALAGAAGALLIGKGAAGIYTDYLWYQSLGAADVWRARYGGIALLRSAAALVATLFVFANLYAVRQSVVSLVLPRRIGNLDIGEEVPRPQLTWAAAAMSAALGLALAWPKGDWATLTAALHGVNFGESDPYFAADLGFYVYWLPFELGAFTWTLTMVLIVIGIVVGLYALTPSLRWESGSLYISGYVRRHLAMLAGVLLLMLAWHYRLAMFTLLGGAADGPFGYLDHRVRIPANLLLSLVTLGAGLAVLWAGWTGQMRLAFAAITGVLVAAIGAKVIAPFVVDRVAADRDPVARENPYQATRAAYSRRAFAVDRIEAAPADVAFPSLDVAGPFVPVWDPRALESVGGLAPGSSFAWTVSDSGLQTLGVTAAGSLVRLLPSVAGPGGLPMRPVQDEPRVNLLIVPDPAARARVVGDSAGQIPAPSLGSRVERFVHALTMQDFRIWLGDLPAHPRLVARRSVRERIAALMPLFVQGERITPVWSAGTLYWTVDLYSASSTYPLSRRTFIAGAERAYFHHAATALVNASTGHTLILADSTPDPLARTWAQRFPKLMSRPTAVPLAVRRQLQPAFESARARAATLARFGMSAGNAEQNRHLPDDEGADSALAGSPAPLLGIPALGGAVLGLPILDSSDRLRGVLLAGGGPSQRAMWWQAQAPGPSWPESIDRLRAADTLAGAQVTRGHTRAVPVAGGIALVQPRYEWHAGDAPRLLYVGVLDADSVRTAPALLGFAPPADTKPISAADFRTRVTELYAAMRRAMARGDWAAYGRAFNELGTLLSRARE